MGRPRTCACWCKAPPPPNCFGCVDPSAWFPSVWQLDMPSAITTIASRKVAPVATNVPFPWQQGSASGSVDYPTIPTSSLLIVDDRPITEYSFDYVTCIWLSNDAWVYEKVRGAVVPVAVGCTHNGHYPTLRWSPNYKPPTPWHWYESPLVTVSPNRIRTHIFSDHPRNALCGTSLCSAIPGTSHECFYQPYGSQWLLQIENTAAGKKLVATLQYYLRLNVRYILETALGGSGWTPDFTSYHDAYPNVSGISYGVGWPQAAGTLQRALCAALFPAYTGTSDNINIDYGSPAIVRYEKLIDCDTDFTGTPVTLTKAFEFKASAISTKTIREMLSMGATPSYITLTPIT